MSSDAAGRQTAPATLGAEYSTRQADDPAFMARQIASVNRFLNGQAQKAPFAIADFGGGLAALALPEAKARYWNGSDRRCTAPPPAGVGASSHLTGAGPPER